MRNHPKLRRFWAEYLTGELSDDPDLEEDWQADLTSAEIAALFMVTEPPVERHVLAKLLALIGLGR